ncbi:helix-turn-helix transcriptional regulator [Agrobacterium tumefaciens]|uniref:Helix-turn-helix transcriptional regulator n=2 Tax=Rhizobium/Agrobacterium group TaxID=227290 RepID=A0ABX8TFV0_9HYPH|nr:helix-turn-helix transcriptional regulator [Agrobacterium tumefaciens]QYA10866.1 helix-turn-helix transcriptional regulator [Agrobacterium larrymoorei]
MDEKLGQLLRLARDEEALSRVELAALVGLNPVVYGRYEKADSRMTVVRMIHMCELLGVAPEYFTAGTAPHLYGRTPDEADDYVRLMDMISKLPADAVSDLREFVSRIRPEHSASVTD